METYLIGIDVGTGSARAGVFQRDGRLLASARHDIALFRDERRARVEQSSSQIWEAVCQAVRAAVTQADIDPAAVSGIGFDATCSLVVQGARGGVGEPGHPERDVIVWMDHRALEQAQRINAGGHAVLSYVGGVISPEMETPKLLWLKEQLPEVYRSAAQFFDLTDFLTWKATGSLQRSSCTVTCKWTYLAHEGRWDADYFRSIGLGDLADEGFVRIGQEVVWPGTALRGGLSAQAAQALQLRPGIAVAAGLIDAHAGGIGTVAARGGAEDAAACMAYVFGTSSCTMTSHAEPVFVPGIWGPYYNAMAPGMWLNEGGQSAAGAAIDHLLRLHPAEPQARQHAAAERMELPQWLAQRALQAVTHPSQAAWLAGQINVVPEFLGNRSPLADPQARALLLGLGMEQDIDSLVALYVAGLCSLGYGLRQIIDAQAARGLRIASISVSGGAGTHALTRQLLADTTGLPVEFTACPEPVLLGSAMLAAVAAGIYPDLRSAMPAMSSVAGREQAAGGDIARLHAARYQVFLNSQQLARVSRDSLAPLLAAQAGQRH
ncbi:FGGY-family carbohydrate kinase [Herbaspirillum sp. AP02]|uniref:FGGY-family carbohydrate kinase n=1 Tax=unclassified Herbaspirillum TaxID=2624150 RepID=UPI0015DB4D74|nr:MULTISPECIES: FGGY-family carbohydrate kinase [unclassified Herbaspirillum]MBG7622570.1 FGGY-family carbohydrate kinase [Herbaspirillum sp. AP02]NZD70488.1 FGGY-family carbohydrate kinase [Herbaspirillum sp. AP21]